MLEIESSYDPGTFSPEPLSIIAEGQDSTVYRWGSKVVKIYDSPLTNGESKPTREEIALYQIVTNTAAGLTIPELIVPGVKIRVNPIIHVSEIEVADKKLPISVSAFVEGETLNRELVTIGETNFYSHRFNIKLNQLDKFLNTTLYTSGIDLRGVNIKYTGKEVVITDLCAWIGNLRVHKY